MENTLVELLKKNGFTESEHPLKDIYFNHCYLTYSAERDSSGAGLYYPR